MSLIMFILGSIFGSFFHVMFMRRDWYKGRSRCDSCGYTLKWFDLIPILSYIILLGRCRKCKEKIPPTHFISEILMGCTFLCASFCFSKYDVFTASIIAVGLLFMTLCAIQDLIEQHIYSELIYSGIIVTAVMKLVLVVTRSNLSLGAQYSICLLCIKIFFLIISKLSSKEVGAGDFDILMLMFVISEWEGLIYGVFYGSFIGCLVCLPMLLAKKMNRKTPIPFVPLLTVGTLCYFMIGGMIS